MRRAVLGSILLALLLPVSLFSQDRGGRDTVPSVSSFRPLQLPGPNQYRTGSGRPGPAYWQQRVDYRIAATLDTARKEIRGRETIHYTNRSPEALSYLWMFLEQNICGPTSITEKL